MRLVVLMSWFVGSSFCAFGSAESNRWCELKTDNFTLYTDLANTDAVELSLDLQKFHVAASQMLGATEFPTTHLKIVAFADAHEFLKEMGQREFIGFMQPSLYEHSLIFARETRTQKHNQVPFHEYAHFLLRATIPSALPLWFEEGLAQYLSTMEFDDDSTAILGKIPRRQLLRAVRSNNLDWPSLIGENSSIEWHARDLTHAYRIAWALLHFVIYESEKEMTSTRELIDQVISATDDREQSNVLFRLTQVSEDEFEESLLQHLRNRNLKQIKFKYDQPRLEFSAPRCLSTTEIHILLGTAIAKTNLERARELLARALNQNDSDPFVLMALSAVNAGNTVLAIEYARRAYESDSMLPETNITLANALVNECVDLPRSSCQQNVRSATSLYLNALRLDPLRVDAAYGLGLVYLIQGRPGDALNYLRVVQKRAPWSPRVNFHLGEAYSKIGQIVNAERFLEKSARWETDDAMKIRSIELLTELPSGE